MASKIVLTLGFANGSDYAEEITFSDLPDTVIGGAKAAVKAVNASLAGGTDNGLGAFFADPDDNQFSRIVQAKVVTEEVTLLT